MVQVSWTDGGNHRCLGVPSKTLLQEPELTEQNTSNRESK